MIAGILFVIDMQRAVFGIEVTENADGGPSAQQMADIIVDDASLITIVASSANTTINAAGAPSSDNDAYGSFTNGVTAPGTLLPAANQNTSGNAQYAGGIQINTGVCLCTGVLEDEPNAPVTGRGSGVLGPNNGLNNDPTFMSAHPGEIVTVLGTPVDQDFEDLAFPNENAGGGDATVIQFQIDLESPGFLRVSFVFGSDENPFFIDQFGVNDSIAIIIDGEHHDPENIATTTVSGVTTPFDLFEFEECGLPLFIDNDVAPAPSELVGSAHSIPGGAPFYNIEFGGFTKKLTRETPRPLAPGTYTIKFVVQDVGDTKVDAGLFIEAESLKLFELAQGDYDRNGIVDTGDYAVWRANWLAGTSPAYFSNGDGNGNGVVDEGDYNIWWTNHGETGNRDWSADFNRDGCVGDSDFAILVGHYQGVLSCASRFEGDANGDGAVEDGDFGILVGQYQESCDGESLAAGGDEGDENLDELLASVTDDNDLIDELRSKWKAAAEDAERTAVVVLAPIAKTLIPENADANGDGRVDEADIAIIDKAVGYKEE
jgi:hypothetical protein